ncbi:MAG: serine/threonine-protein kinase Nek [archaeon]|nr:serine/threonine-protein kinase Nek [archaeon]
MAFVQPNDIINGYKIKKNIGVGSYGSVYLVEKNSKIYVLKRIPIASHSSEEEKTQIKSEAKLLSLMNSNYIVKYYDSFEQSDVLYIIMEYCEGGDLEKFLLKNKQNPLNEDLIWKIFIQICLGIYMLHSKKILHRDLKSLNIFLTKDFNAKIGDLGVAKNIQKTNFASTFIGTPYYLSPEICEEKQYNEKSDIWALGCILYEMASFKHPFDGRNQAALFLKILNGKYEPLPIRVSSEIKQMVKKLLDKNDKTRPSIIKIIEDVTFLEKAKKIDLIKEVMAVYPDRKKYFLIL